MNRRSFLQHGAYASVVTGCAKEATLDPAAERYKQLQAAALKKRGLDYSEHDVEIASLGLRAHVLEVGSGEPLLLIHGGNGVGAHWIPLMTRLGGWRTLVPDRPGCGLTDGFLYDGVDMRAHGAAFVEGVASIHPYPPPSRSPIACRTRVWCCYPTQGICRGSTSSTNAPR